MSGTGGSELGPGAGVKPAGGWHRVARRLMGESQSPLWVLVFGLFGPPIAWSVHLLVIYFFVVVGCRVGWTGVAIWGIVLSSVALLAVSVAGGVIAFRAWRKLDRERGFLAALVDPRGRETFLLHMSVLGAAIFSLLTVLESLPPVFVPLCSLAIP